MKWKQLLSLSFPHADDKSSPTQGAIMSRESNERDTGTLRRMSNVFSNINAKLGLHKDRKWFNLIADQLN